MPGPVGATPVQNVGAYGQDVSQPVVPLSAHHRAANGGVGAIDGGFRYRWSRVKGEPGRWVVLAVTYRLDEDKLGREIRYPELARTLGVEVGGRAPVGEVRDAVLALRRGKGMVL